jgi:hypothetical protein
VFDENEAIKAVQQVGLTAMIDRMHKHFSKGLKQKRLRVGYKDNEDALPGVRGVNDEDESQLNPKMVDADVVVNFEPRSGIRLQAERIQRREHDKGIIAASDQISS